MSGGVLNLSEGYAARCARVARAGIDHARLSAGVPGTTRSARPQKMRRLSKSLRIRWRFTGGVTRIG